MKPEFEDGFERFVRRVERVLLRLVILSLVLLVGGQVLLADPDMAVFLSTVDRLEGRLVLGQPEEAAAPAGAVQARILGTVTVMVVDRPSAPEAVLLLNGERVGDFAEGLVTVEVRAGDELAVQLPEGYQRTRFRVVGVTGMVAMPRPGREAVGSSGILPLGRVEGR